MNTLEINDILNKILALRQKLAGMSYSDKAYDEVEDELHDFEDDFNEEFGDYFEEILEEIHEKLLSDSDVLLPSAYIGTGLKENALYTPKDGVIIESDSKLGKNLQLVLLPSPVRFVVAKQGAVVDTVWQLND